MGGTMDKLRYDLYVTLDKLRYDLFVTLDKLRSLDKTKEASFLYFDFSAFVNKFSRL